MSRRARRPVAALTVLALIPAIGLGAVAWWAHGKVPAEVSAAPSDTTPVVQPAAMATPLLSIRRSPAVLAADRRHDLVSASMAPLADSIDATSCLVIDLDDQQVLGRNADLAVIPASNLKIVTAAVALDVLGAGTTFTTTVVGPAPVDGVIDGDVYLVGGGDPVLSEQWYTQPSSSRKRPPLHPTDVNALADALKNAGVTRITGKVLGDGSRYDTEAHPPGWSSDIQATVDGVPVGALVINDSISQSGGIAKDPAASAAKTFAGLLGDRGVQVGGSGTGTAPGGQAVLASVQSAPLTDLLNEMLATSDNLSAEMLVKEIGVAVAQQGTRAAGLQAISDRLTQWGVPMAGVHLTDGSGLSRDNQLTCATLSAVLTRGTPSDPVGNGLAIAGQAGGTLADAFPQPGLTGALHGKTGTLTGVKSLSGYVMVGSDEIDFVLILNGASAADYQATWDKLAAALLASAGGPTADSLAPVAS